MRISAFGTACAAIVLLAACSSTPSDVDASPASAAPSSATPSSMTPPTAELGASMPPPTLAPSTRVTPDEQHALLATLDDLPAGWVEVESGYFLVPQPGFEPCGGTSFEAVDALLLTALDSMGLTG